MNKKTAVVIGSGIAGMSLAEILSRNDYKVIILESQDKIGGEASLATQKWYHTGWLYAALPNKSAMMGCYNALHLYKKVYQNIFSQNIVNLEITENGVDYLSTRDGWFIDDRIHFLFALSTYELSLWEKFYWPIYLKHLPFKRLKKLNYQLDVLMDYDSNMKNLMNQWENDENGNRKYKVIRTTDAKIDTSRIMRSLVSNLSSNTEIITSSLLLYTVSFTISIENPSFDSQTKERLITPPSKFGSKPNISDKFAKQIIEKTTLVEKVLQFNEFKLTKENKKTDGIKRNKIRDIPKLDDANWAGTKKSDECILILTEGDSAKSMAISGLSVVGRDKYGVFPLKGKVMNVKDASQEQILKNAEITNLKKILGLVEGKEYKDTKLLR